MLGVMAAILVAIAVPSYLAMRDRAHDSDARANIRRAVDALEAYGPEQGTYAGVVPAALTRYGDKLTPSSVRVMTKADRYCVQSSVGGRTWHQTGPAGELSRGSCPTPAR